jgi:hypothetical protein
MADVYGEHVLGSGEAAFDDGFAQWVCEQKESFLYTEGDE